VRDNHQVRDNQKHRDNLNPLQISNQFRYNTHQITLQ
jgi:hypothetical protein